MKRILFSTLILSVMVCVNAQPKVGIVLGGGGALGFAHIGVLQAFDENGIEFDCVSGASMGALVGVFYAAGYSPTDILNMIGEEGLNRTAKLLSSGHRTSHTGLSSQKTLRRLLEKYVPYDTFDSIPKRYYLSVTNLTTSKSNIVGTGGNLHDYVVATASVPGIYEAVTIGDCQYVDGGVLNNLPAQPLVDIEHCDIVIGVDALPHLDREKPLKKVAETTLEALRVMQQGNARVGAALCNYLIVSEAIGEYDEFDFKKYKEIYNVGYEAATKYISEHPELLKLKRQE